MHISEQTFGRWIEEDVPYFDPITHLLGIGQRHGSIPYSCRSPATLACTEKAARVLTKQGLHMTVCLPFEKRRLSSQACENRHPVVLSLSFHSGTV